MKYINIQKSMLKATIEEVSSYNDGFRLVLVNSNTWDFDLPDNLKDQKFINIDLKGWSLEQSIFDDEGIFLQTAFGQDEYSRKFTWDEIVNVLTFDGRVLYQKVIAFNTLLDETIQDAKDTIEPTEPKFKGVPKKLSLSNIDEVKVQFSMDTMLKRNKHLKGK